MAALTSQQRAEVATKLMRELSAENAPCPALKAAFRAAVDAADDWRHANANSYNLALPQPFRGDASAVLKARVLMGVVEKFFASGAV
jgi:hypothetical protein